MNKIAPFEMSFQIQAKPGARLTAREVGVATNSGRLPRITQVLALAILLESTIRNGEAKDYADIARLGGLSRERVSQIVRLTYLAPDIQVELLYLPPTPTGRYPISETAMRKIADLLSWTGQRQEWARLKARLTDGPDYRDRPSSDPGPAEVHGSEARSTETKGY